MLQDTVLQLSTPSLLLLVEGDRRDPPQNTPLQDTVLQLHPLLHSTPYTDVGREGGGDSTTPHHPTAPPSLLLLVEGDR